MERNVLTEDDKILIHLILNADEYLATPYLRELKEFENKIGDDGLKRRLKRSYGKLTQLPARSIKLPGGVCSHFFSRFSSDIIPFLLMSTFTRTTLHLLGSASNLWALYNVNRIANPYAEGFGGHFQYLTILGLTVATISYLLCLIRDFIPGFLNSKSFFQNSEQPI